MFERRNGNTDNSVFALGVMPFFFTRPH